MFYKYHKKEMKVFRTHVAFVDANFYMVYEVDSHEAVLIDPGAVSEKMDEAIAQFGRENISYILLTHGHFDHIGASAYYKDMTGAQIVMNEKEKDFVTDGSLNLGYGSDEAIIKPFKPDKLLSDGDVLPIWGSEVKMISTPGHTVGSCCYLIGDSLFTGDTIMMNSVGRTDFPTGDKKALEKSLEKLYDMEGDYKVYPGHGEITTLDEERKNNPYFVKNNNNFNLYHRNIDDYSNELY